MDSDLEKLTLGELYRHLERITAELKRRLNEKEYPGDRVIYIKISPREAESIVERFSTRYNIEHYFHDGRYLVVIFETDESAVKAVNTYRDTYEITYKPE